jgi:DNA-binding IclR family transcriptional regulator
VSELRRVLTDVRRRGHAWEEDLVTVGLSSVAQAVVDHVGHPVAGVAVTYTAAEVDDAEQRNLVRAVNRTADLLSRRLGGGARR